MPACIAFNDPLSVQTTLPEAPTVGAVKLQPVNAAGNGVLQIAETNVVYTGVVSVTTIIDTGALAVLV